MRKAQARVTSPMSTVAGLLLVAIVLRISSYDLSANAQMGPVSEPEIAPETILDIPFSKEGIERILDAFEQREAALIEAERKLENRRQTLNRSKSDILAKIDELENLETRLAATLAIADSGAKDAAELFSVMTPNFAAALPLAHSLFPMTWLASNIRQRTLVRYSKVRNGRPMITKIYYVYYSNCSASREQIR